MHDDRIVEKLEIRWILFSNVVCCLRVHKLVTAIKVAVRLRWGRGGGIGALETTITSSLFVTIMVTIFIGRFVCMCMCMCSCCM